MGHSGFSLCAIWRASRELSLGAGQWSFCGTWPAFESCVEGERRACRLAPHSWWVLAVSTTIAFDKEMAITHRDFVRLLARAVGHKNFRLADGKILIADGRRKMEITLSEEFERRIALVALPVIFVRFAFTGYEDAQAEMKCIDMHFQRGGG